MLNRYSIAILTAVLVGVATVRAQNRYADSFYVTVADKTPEHPYYGQGYAQGFVINGRQSPTLTLVRDSLYIFNTHDLPDELLFEFYTIPIGGVDGTYRRHVEDFNVNKQIWIIKADDRDPDTLYYATYFEPWVGGTILIVDSITSSVAEERWSVVRHGTSTLTVAGAYPNPFAVETELRFTLPERAVVDVQLVDVLGRVVSTLEAGAREPGPATIRLSAAGLDAGVYLYRITARSEEREAVATGKLHVR